MTGGWAAVAAAVATWMWGAPRTRSHGRASGRSGDRSQGRSQGLSQDRRATGDGRRSSAVLLTALAAGLGTWAVVGGSTGVVLGLLVGIGVRIGVPRLESTRRRRERELLERQAPLLVDLVAACLASGSPLLPSLVAAGRAVGDPAASLLLTAVASVQFGADPALVWRDLARHEPLSGLARSVARSAETGAPLAELLPRVADRARAVARARVEARVRTVSVRLTAPLGLAFLPAFVLLGVVPVVAAWIGVLL